MTQTLETRLPQVLNSEDLCGWKEIIERGKEDYASTGYKQVSEKTRRCLKCNGYDFQCVNYLGSGDVR